MKKYLRFKKLVSICALLSISFLYGCKKHDLSKLKKDIAYDQNLAVPLGYGEFDIHDLLAKNDSLISVGPLGVLELVYEDDLDTITAQEVIQLPDFSMPNDMLPPNFNLAVTPNFNGVITNTDVRNSDYVASNGVELHALNFLSGSCTLNLSTTIQHDVSLVITMLDLQYNSAPIVRTLDVHYTGSVPQIASTVIDLTDVLADFTAGNVEPSLIFNRLRVNVAATITGLGNPITGTESLDLTMSMTNLEFKNITGYFGQNSLTSVTDSITMKIFNNEQSGNINFTNPKLNFTIDNTFGIPIDIDFSNLSSYQVEPPSIVTPLILDPSVASTSIDYPHFPLENGINQSTDILLNNTNTQNISSLIEAVPKFFKYSVDVTSNPLGHTSELNYIENSSRMIIKAKLTLPFQGYASDFVVSDTMKLNGATYGKNAEHIKSIMLRLNLNNGFPIAFKGNLEFKDSLNNTVFNMFTTDQQFVSAAFVDGNGKVSSSASSINDYYLTDSQIALLSQVKKVIIRGKAESTQPLNTEVIIYDTYKIALKLGIQVQAK